MKRLVLLFLIAVGYAQHPTPTVNDRVEYTSEYTVAGASANQIMNAVKAWLLVHATVNTDHGMVDDMVNDTYSGKFYMKVQGLNGLTDKVAKGDITYTLELQAFEGRYLLKLYRFETTEPIRSKTLAQKYMLDYAGWKKEYTTGLSGEERMQRNYQKYQEESEEALRLIHLTVEKNLKELTDYVANNH